jgi:hypothetical protein
LISDCAAFVSEGEDDSFNELAQFPALARHGFDLPVEAIVADGLLWSRPRLGDTGEAG